MAYATRLMPSEMFLVKITSDSSGVPMNSATLMRAPSYASVASSPSWCVARWMLALCRE